MSTENPDVNAKRRIGPRECGRKSCYVTVYRLHKTCRRIRHAMDVLGAAVVGSAPSEVAGYLFQDTYRVPIQRTLADVKRFLVSRGISAGQIGFSERNGQVCGSVTPFGSGSGDPTQMKARKLACFREKQREAKVGSPDPLPQSVLECCYPAGIDWAAISFHNKTAPRPCGRNPGEDSDIVEDDNKATLARADWQAFSEAWKMNNFTMDDWACLALSWPAFRGTYCHLRALDDAYLSGEGEDVTSRLEALLRWARLWIDSPECSVVKLSLDFVTLASYSA